MLGEELCRLVSTTCLLRNQHCLIWQSQQLEVVPNIFFLFLLLLFDWPPLYNLCQPPLHLRTTEQQAEAVRITCKVK